MTEETTPRATATVRVSRNHGRAARIAALCSTACFVVSGSDPTSGQCPSSSIPSFFIRRCNTYRFAIPSSRHTRSRTPRCFSSAAWICSTVYSWAGAAAQRARAPARPPQSPPPQPESAPEWRRGFPRVRGAGAIRALPGVRLVPVPDECANEPRREPRLAAPAVPSGEEPIHSWDTTRCACG